MKVLLTALIGLLVSAFPPASAQDRPKSQEECVVPEVLAESAFSVSCRSSAADLVQRLLSQTACGTGSKTKTGDACAVILYVTDRELARQFDLPLTVTVRIGRVSHVPARDETVITLVKSNGSAENLVTSRIYELLLPIRVDERVRVYDESGTGTRFDQKVGLFSQGIRYYPALFVGRGEADKAMTRQAIKRHFSLPIQIMQNLELLLSPRCLIEKDCTG